MLRIAPFAPAVAVAGAVNPVCLGDDRDALRHPGRVGAAIGATIAAMAAFEPTVGLLLFAAFVALAIDNKIWK